MPKFKRQTKSDAIIPTASMADIAFLLLIFFVTVTTFRVYKGLPVHVPYAEQSARLTDKTNLAYVWVDRDGNISIDDRLVASNVVRFVVNDKMVANPYLIISIKIDRQARYGIVNTVLEELRRAGALRVNFATSLNE